MPTVNKDLTSAAWTALTTAGDTRAIIQVKDRDACLIHMGTSTPAVDSDAGMVLSRIGQISAVSMDVIPANEIVYGRAIADDTLVCVISWPQV